MAKPDAEEITSVPAGKGFDVPGCSSGRDNLRATCGCNRSRSEDHSALDSASKREPESSPARIAATGILGAKMRTWNSCERSGPPVGVPLVRGDGNAEPSRFSGWDASPLERGGKKEDGETEAVRPANARYGETDHSEPQEEVERPARSFFRWIDWGALFWAILVGALAATVLYYVLGGAEAHAQCGGSGSCASRSPLVAGRPGRFIPWPARAFRLSPRSGWRASVGVWPACATDLGHPTLGLRFVGYQGPIINIAPPVPAWGLYRTEFKGSIVTIWGWPDPRRSGYVQWMPSYQPNQLILARARLLGEKLATQ